MVLMMLMLPLTRAVAVEVAPRISDREIIESLATLKAGQKALAQQMNVRFAAVDQRFKSMDQRFDDLDKKLSGRIDDLHDIMLAILLGIFGLIGFIIWDRRTMIKPLEQRFVKLTEKIEMQDQFLQRDLELQSPDGSKLTRILHALRELARTDPKVAAVLKQFSLM